MDIELTRALDQIESMFFGLLPEQAKAGAGPAIRQLKLAAVRLALEVLESENRGTPFAEAVRQHGDYPLMARVHFGVLDLLQYELKSGEVQLVAKVINLAPGIDDAPIRNAIVDLASSRDASGWSSLARFALYELVRLGIWTATWGNGGAEIEAAGALDSLDKKAETLLRRRMMAAPLVSKGEDPIRLLLFETLLHLHVAYSQRVAELRHAVATTVQRFELRTEVLEVVRQLGAPEAAIVRNELDGGIGYIPLGSQQLADRNRLIFPSPAAVDQRRSRLLGVARREPNARAPRAKGPRLVDMLVEAIQEGRTKQ